MLRKKIEIEEKWHHPPTSIYEDNYGYLANYYQPMLDYLDDRDKRGVVSREYPHIPWTNERGLEKYRPGNKIQKYPTYELNALASTAEEDAKHYVKSLAENTGIKSSDFAKIKSVQASRLSEHLRQASVNKSVRKSLLDKSRRRKSRTKAAQEEEEMAGTDNEIALPFSQISKRPQILAQVPKIKSISSIKHSLLFEAHRNLNSDNTDVNQVNYRNRQNYYANESAKYHNVLSGKALWLNTRNNYASYDDSTTAAAGKPSWVNQKHNYANGDNKEVVKEPVKYVPPVHSFVDSELHQLENKATSLFENTSKQTSIEIEQLNARVVEAETKLKTEITRIKKKFQITITDLELSLDVANKNNLELQKTVKKQSLQLTELQAHYDEIQRQLAVTLDQLGVVTRKNQSLTGELEEIRGNYDNVSTVRPPGPPSAPAPSAGAPAPWPRPSYTSRPAQIRA